MPHSDHSQPATPQSLQTVQLFGLPIIAESFNTVLATLSAPHTQPVLVATPNPEQIVQAAESSEFQATLKQMDLLLPDGIGLILASQILAAADTAEEITERITGVDLVQALLTFAETNKKTTLVIGGRGYEGSGEVATGFKEQDVYQLTLDTTSHCYWISGYQNIGAPTPAEEQRVTQVLKKLKPRYVFVALGAPHQEQWLLKYRDILKANHCQVGMAVGGTFDVLTGQLRRAPSWMLQLHLEWLYRLWQEPWRWRRQLRLLQFIKLVVQEVIADKK